MKKIYIKPEMQTVDVQVESDMMAASNLTFDNEGVYGDDVEVLSKGHSFSVWGDEEEEE